MIILMISIKKLLLLALVTIIGVSCARVFSKGTNSHKALTAYSNVNVNEFQSLIADSNVQLLDVRTQEEYDEGHIANSILVDVNGPDFVEKAMAVLDANRPVAVYCRSGRRSARAANLLTAQELKVTNLNGGILAWQDEGKALVK